MKTDYFYVERPKVRMSIATVFHSFSSSRYHLYVNWIKVNISIKISMGMNKIKKIRVEWNKWN